MENIWWPVILNTTMVWSSKHACAVFKIVTVWHIWNKLFDLTNELLPWPPCKGHSCHDHILIYAEPRRASARREQHLPIKQNEFIWALPTALITKQLCEAVLQSVRQAGQPSHGLPSRKRKTHGQLKALLENPSTNSCLRFPFSGETR